MSAPIRLLVTDFASAKFLERVQESPSAEPFEIVAPEREEEDALCEAVREVEAILCYKALLPGSAIRAAKSLRFIQKFGLNCKNIDLAAAAERNVPVATLRLMRNATVAEQALALMLACARKVVAGHRVVSGATYLEMGIEPIKTSQWEMNTNWTRIEGVTELFENNVGIIGLGDIGMEIARRCNAFGMKVYYHQRTRHTEDVEAEFQATYLPSFDELLATSDYLVLILPHTPQTEGMMGAAQFARMKPTATLINVGRGGLVDEDALNQALRGGQIAMAGVDVYRNEPLPSTSPLRELPNIVFTPHLGGGSYRAWEVDVPNALENILHFFQGKEPSGIVKPSSR